MLICMCGCAGCGKSTKAKELAKWYNAEIVSTDEIRKELFGDAAVQKNNQKVFETAFERIKKILQEGKPVIFDATNVTVKDRGKVLEIGKKWNRGFNIIYYSLANKETCIERNGRRDRKVPNEAIERQFRRFVAPTYDEGWDVIKYF